MMNIFQIPPNDQSVYYLGQIFGYVGNLLPSQGSLILGTMFKIFNTMALVLGSLIVVYTTIVGLFATAAEGEFLGKKWSGLWVPLRMVLGIAALFPTSTGYSSLQVIMMWCILQGVGAANTVWSTVLNYLQIAGTPYAAVSIPAIGVSTTMTSLFQSLTCQAEAISAYPPSANAKWYCTPPMKTVPPSGGLRTIMGYIHSETASPPAFCQTNPQDLLNVTTGPQVTRPSPGVIQYNMGPQGMCGSLSFCDASDPSICNLQTQGATTAQANIATVKCAACKAQAQALQTIVTTLGTLAANFATSDYQYVNFYDSGAKAPDWITAYCVQNNIPPDPDHCCVVGPHCSVGNFYPDTASGTPQPMANTSNSSIDNLFWPWAVQPTLKGSDFINSSVNYYISNIVGSVTTAIAQSAPAQLSGWQQTARENGWLLAGAYYYQIANMSNSTLNNAIPPLSAKNKDPNPADGSVLGGFRTNFQAISQLVTDMQAPSQGQDAVSAALPPQLATLMGSGQGLISTFMQNLTHSSLAAGNNNPVSSIQEYGEGLLIFAQILFAAFLVAALILTTTGNFKAWVLGTGVDPGIGEGLVTIIMILIPLFFAFLGALFVFGGTLAVYVPLIPFILFTMAAIGWFIGTIEAMVAAPLIALGILSPGGQHEILGKAEPALLLLLNVVLRPSLMIFGMIIAMLLVVVTVQLVNSTFLFAISTILPAPGLPEFIMILAAYTFLIISVVEKCFSLVHLIPERVLTWIGGQAVTYGEEQALGGVKKGVEGAAGVVAAAPSGMMEQAKAGAKGEERLAAGRKKGGGGVVG